VPDTCRSCRGGPPHVSLPHPWPLTHPAFPCITVRHAMMSLISRNRVLPRKLAAATSALFILPIITIAIITIASAAGM